MREKYFSFTNENTTIPKRTVNLCAKPPLSYNAVEVREKLERARATLAQIKSKNY